MYFNLDFEVHIYKVITFYTFLLKFKFEHKTEKGPQLPERFYSDIFTYMYVSLKRMFMQGLQYTPVLFSYSSITQTN